MKILFAALILIIILFGGYYIIRSSHTTKPGQTKTTMAQNKVSKTPITLQGTLKNLLDSNKSEKCTYSANAGSSLLNGIVYVSDGKMKGDFTSGINKAATVSGHIIIDSPNAYIWTDISKNGLKFSLASLTASNSAGVLNTQAPNLNQQVSYSCQNWKADNSVFTLPANISFTALNLPSVPDNGNKAACSACNNLPAAPQQACKTQLNCQ